MDERCKHDMVAAWCGLCLNKQIDEVMIPSMDFIQVLGTQPDAEDVRVALARETYRLMPRLFVERYAELAHLGLGTPMNGRGPDRAGSGSGLDRPTMAYGGVIRDAVAVTYRQAVDGRLRALSRDVRAFLTTSPRERRGIVERVTRKCSGCGKYVDDDWRHCAWCGCKQKVDHEQPDRSKRRRKSNPAG